MQKLHQPSSFLPFTTFILYPLLNAFLTSPFFMKAFPASDLVQNRSSVTSGQSRIVRSYSNELRLELRV
jgi:hypothetical protein